MAWVHTHQIAHQKGVAAALLLQRKAVARQAHKQGVPQQLFVGFRQGFDHLLQCRHRAGQVVPLAQLQHHIALGLLDLKDRSDGAATLGNHWLQRPGS